LSYEHDALQGPVAVHPDKQSPPPQSPSRFKRYGLPFLLLCISVVTTTAIGARYMQNFLDGLPTVVAESDLWPWPWLLQQPSRFQLGWPFSLTLLSILISHELGHYFACRVHGIRCTLPWVLPAPTLSGTAGAVIQIRSRIPNRRALMDVGAYGPLAGYAVSLVAVVVGMLLSRPIPDGGVRPLINFGHPLTLRLIHDCLHVLSHPAVPRFEAALQHPILIAGWVGLFITALNLIPSGQLDGGHILFALSPRWHRTVSRILPFVLLAFGFYFWIGWFFWGALLWIPAMRHPKVTTSEPLGKRRFLAVSCLAVFLLTFAAEPFTENSIRAYLHWPGSWRP
jgi:membrane-associated protease RseP (regulator of RpoE activity)